MKKVKQILTVCGVILGGFMVGSPVGALTFSQDVDVEFTWNPTLTMSLSSDDILIDNLVLGGGTGVSNSVAITVDTNNLYGYTLKATAGNASNASTDLVHSTDSTKKFTSVATDASLASLSSNTWGYALSSDNSTWGNYSGLPVYTGTAKDIVDSDSAGGGTKYFRIGATAGAGLLAGDYTNVINFTAVTNVAPLPSSMQDFSAADFTAMAVGSTTTLEDTRTPGTSYEVKMLELNGTRTLWMMGNLELPGGTVLTSADTNFNSDASATTWTMPSDTGASDWENDFCKPYMVSASDSNHPEYGTQYYYNWPAAVMNNSNVSNTSSCSASNESILGDICPKGWRIPTNTEITAGTWLTDIKSGAGLATTGSFYSGSQTNVGSVGYWWTSTRSSSRSAYLLYFDESSAGSSYLNKSNGLSVRCLRTS